MLPAPPPHPVTPAAPVAPGPYASLLVSLQLADPGFPGGPCDPAYEWDCLVRPGRVDRAGLGPLLHALLRHGVGPSDATALAPRPAPASVGGGGAGAPIEAPGGAAQRGPGDWAGRG
ncbi:hypothetical protein ACFXBC_24400, partial [Streptomyces sp. NPDC059398]